MQFEIETASVAYGFALIVTAPQGGRRRRAIGAPQAQTSRSRLFSNEKEK